MTSFLVMSGALGVILAGCVEKYCCKKDSEETGWCGTLGSCGVLMYPVAGNGIHYS